jgi:small-conductance mechanosensitive channel
MTAFLKYTVARLAILVIAYVVLWALASLWWQVPTIDPFVLLAAILVSSVVSIFVLRGLRDDLATRLQQRANHATQRVEASRDVDDID